MFIIIPIEVQCTCLSEFQDSVEAAYDTYILTSQECDNMFYGSDGCDHEAWLVYEQAVDSAVATYQSC